MNKRWIIVLALALTLALAACGPNGTTTPVVTTGGGQQQPTQSGPSIVPPVSPQIARVDRLDPALADEAAAAITPYLYSNLVAEGDIPDLATGWTVSENGLEYTLTLRQGVTFKDDTAFNADVVLANFDRWYDPASALRGSGTYDAWKQLFLGFKGEVGADNKPLSFYDGVEKVDAYTVIIHLNRPEPSLLTILSDPHFAMVSPAAVALNPSAFGTTASSVVGSGPYVVETWTADGLTLAPNTNYYGSLQTEPLQFIFK